MGGLLRVIEGDCTVELPVMAEIGERYHACVTDPPYEIGFMAQDWDRTGIAFKPGTWRTVWDALFPGAYLLAFGGSRTFARISVAIEDAGFIHEDTLLWLYGTGRPARTTRLKPAYEWIGMFRKGGDAPWVNIEACRVPGLKLTRHDIDSDKRNTPILSTKSRTGTGEMTEGRWPANLLHDGSDEVEEAFAQFGERKASKGEWQRNAAYAWDSVETGTIGAGYGDTGTASRFFWSSKASKADRADSLHPTVKPIDLMRWLVRLVTPPDGHVLDPFAGSGSTGEACMLEGFSCTMIEQHPTHAADIRHRIRRWNGTDLPLLSAAAD